MLNRSLWETSGHWDHYKENMYTTTIDDTEFAIKPMNCPGSMLVYKSQPRSYRDLPLRMENSVWYTATKNPARSTASCGFAVLRRTMPIFI